MTTKAKTKKGEATKEVIYQMTEENMGLLDNFYRSSLQAHSQGVLDYKAAFLKGLDLTKNYLIRKEE